jgi:hypothetical protein
MSKWCSHLEFSSLRCHYVETNILYKLFVAVVSRAVVVKLSFGRVVAHSTNVARVMDKK